MSGRQPPKRQAEKLSSGSKPQRGRFPQAGGKTRGSSRGSIHETKSTVRGVFPPVPEIPEANNNDALAEPSGFDTEVEVKYDILKNPTPNGSKGLKIVLHTNHFKLEIAREETVIQRYVVEITRAGVATSRPLTKEASQKIFSELLRTQPDVFRGASVCFDKRSAVYTVGELQLTPGRNEFEVPFTIGGRPGDWRVAILHTNSIPLNRLEQYMQGEVEEEPMDVLQALDVACRQECGRICLPVGQSFYHSRLFGKTELGMAVTAIHGFYQSLRPLSGGLFLNLDTTVSAFFSVLSVPKFLEVFLNFRNLRMEDLVSNGEAFRRAKAIIRSLVVESNVGGGTKSRYKLTGLSERTPATATFNRDGGGEEVTVQRYYKERYNLEVNPNFPLLECRRGGRELLLPMERCQVAEGQRYRRTLSAEQVSSLLKASCSPPQKRLEEIIRIAKRSVGGMRDLLGQFGLTAGIGVTSVTARLLQAPAVRFGDRGREKVVVPTTGAWNLKDKVPLNPVRVRKWAILNQSELPEARLTEFGAELATQAGNNGIEMPPCLRVLTVGPFLVEKGLRDLHSECGEDLDLILVVLGEQNNKKAYETVKRVCETELGVPSQCVASRKVPGVKPQYLANVLLKINAKMGGRNFILVEEAARNLPLVSDIPTCIMGADVSHPPPFDQLQPSIAALVASVDWPCANKYASVATAQQAREDVLCQLYVGPGEGDTSAAELGAEGSHRAYGGMARELLLKFRQNVGQFPQRIIMFRDGVSEGQFPQVLNHELPALKKACVSLNFNPKITFLVVTKRHHTRLFPGTNCPKDSSGNVMPGTVVDGEICHPTAFDFFLCSHSGIQGTSRPAHYHVLHDENSVTPDDMQGLTYKLCFTYARCTRSVSLVPPAYYAHLAAVRARCWIQDRFDVSSSSSAELESGQTPATPLQLPTLRGKVSNGMHFC